MDYSKSKNDDKIILKNAQYGKLRKADISPAKGSFRLAPNTVFWWHYLMLLYITRQPIGLSCCLY